MGLSESTLKNINKDIHYIIGNFQVYSQAFPPDRIRGATICELGPGDNIGVALIYKCLGAAQVHVVDKYLKPWHEAYHPFLYRSLAHEIAHLYPQANLEPFEEAQKSHVIKGVSVVNEDAENLASVEPESVDLCYSMAVLEHLYNPPRAFAALARIAKKGSLGFHQVDFRDHFDFSMPLEFLGYHYRWNELPDARTRQWLAERNSIIDRTAEIILVRDEKDQIRRVCGYYGNSWRCWEYADLWLENGFHIIQLEQNCFVDEEYLGRFLAAHAFDNSPAATMPRSELRVASAKFIVQK